jgi:hypothetical protein
LLALDVADDVIKTFAQRAQALNIPLKIIRDTRADGREAYRASLILIRPDQFIAWCGDHPANNLNAIMWKITAK